MQTQFKKGARVTWPVRGGWHVLGRVVTSHRDGSYSVHAMWFVDKTGEPQPGYLGYKYRVEATKLSPEAQP